MLSKLLIRERVNLLVVLPVTVVLFMTVPFVADRLQSVRVAQANAQLAAGTREMGQLVEGLGRERALSIAYLLTPRSRNTSLVEQTESVGDDIYQVRRFYGGHPPAGVDAALTSLGRLDRVRARVSAYRVSVDEVESAYDTAVDGLLNSVRNAASRSVSAQVLALNTLLLANEQANRAAADAMAVLLDPGADAVVRSRRLTAQVVAQQLESLQINEFRAQAPAAEVALFDEVARGQAARRVATVESRAADPSASAGQAGSHAQLASETYAAVETEAQLRELVEDKIARDTAARTSASASRARAVGWLFAGLAVSLLVVMLLLSVAISRSIVRPLQRLTAAAGRVADLAGAELARVADDELGDGDPPRLAAINLGTDDEVGELAGAVNRVQAVAVTLLERQLISRANISAMFRSVGQRTQNLVSRQTAVIDVLERDERDADVLERLYGLDHLTARLRRHADSLLVLSGWHEPALDATPVPLSRLIRSAFGGVEDFQRIQLASFEDVSVSAEIASDLILLLAELLDNAIRFSPPHTEVRVSARPTDDGCQITISDQGIGMPPERMAEENQRIVRRERIDLVPTDVLGLFVVGRLCRRHGLRAWLVPGATAGVTAVVEIPSVRLVPAGQAEPDVSGALFPREREARGRQAGNAIAGPGRADPEQTRRMVDSVEAGLARAREQRAPFPAPSGETAARTPAAGTDPMDDADVINKIRKSLEQATALRSVPDQQGFDWFQAGRSADTPAQQAPPSHAGLVRRVPGTHLSDAHMPVRSAPAAHRTVDAAALRATLEEFEAGVDRGRTMDPP
jgi:signal transduction histidine kinase